MSEGPSPARLPRRRGARCRWGFGVLLAAKLPHPSRGFLFGGCEMGQYYDTKGDCIPCPACKVGEFAQGCKEYDAGTCVKCTNQLPGSNMAYGGDGGIKNACPWVCADGFTWQAASSSLKGSNAGAARLGGSCVACKADCKVGEFNKCTNNTQAGCTACDNYLPEGGAYTSSGGAGAKGKCQFRCLVTGATSGPCSKCKDDCGVGKYRKGCVGDDPGQCVPCTLRPTNSSYYATGGLKDACPWKCHEHHFNNGEDCVPCRACPVGKYRVNCGQASDGLCVDCPAKLPEGATFVASKAPLLTKDCPWSCPEHHYKTESSKCEPCTQCTKAGTYNGGCEGQEVGRKGNCTRCTTGPPGVEYAAPGGFADMCPWKCGLKFFADGNPGETLRCGVGEYRKGCGTGEVGVCEPCSEGGALAFYTDHGGAEDKCPWTCRSSWPFAVTPCIVGFIVNRVLIVILCLFIMVGCFVAVRSQVVDKMPQQRSMGWQRALKLADGSENSSAKRTGQGYQKLTSAPVTASPSGSEVVRTTGSAGGGGGPRGPRAGSGPPSGGPP